MHGWIVVTLGPGHLLRRMWGGQTRWQEAGSLLAAPPSLAQPPNWMNNAAGRPGRSHQNPRLTCRTQKETPLSFDNLIRLLSVLLPLHQLLSPITVC